MSESSVLPEEKIVKVSVCQSCDGWVRAMSFAYFTKGSIVQNNSKTKQPVISNEIVHPKSNMGSAAQP